MGNSRAFVAAVILGAWAVNVPAQTPAGGKPEAPPAGKVESGRELYLKVGCYQCHGLEGQGGGGTGPRLAPNPLPFARFSSYLRAPSGTMPPYRQVVLADQAVADIHAFLRSIPAPPPLSKIPLLAPAQFGVK
jgi:ubiquinol-cytochrome c reductase cytochrome c subunit